MIVGVPDKLLANWLKHRDYIVATDEGEAVAIGAGHYIITGERPFVFMSADGFCNALNPLTSLVIPEEIEMTFIISVGRQEKQHKVMTDSLKKIIKSLKYDPACISFRFIEEEQRRNNSWFSWFNK